MAFNSFLLRGIWLKSTGEFMIISSILLSVIYLLYLSLTGTEGNKISELIFYVQTHFIVFNSVVLPLYLLMASEMIHYYSHDQIKIKHSKISVLVKRQIALMVFHTLFFILIINIPILILSIFNNGFEMLFFIIRSMLIQLPGFMLAASILLYLYYRSQQQGISLLLSIVLLISPHIIGTAIGIESLRSLDYYIYLKHMESFVVTEGLNESITFVLVGLFISMILFLLTVKEGSNQR
ncbi:MULTISPECIES: hypothetical protein [unclassified Sporosarcina]|uniref:hypothetical protein n=1 Tax=unclassified Sporosarcina TaxID=2647733 RepID=UPI001A934BE0|nr:MULTISPECIES: hypothetical protein [unclassified Sporosarcina]MBO0588370.1 hypothetical protein [Sporosarcina sp. E16_8]MBO0603635.1 hypothetical protein [Sporosarcina sp. E16_3]